MRTALKNFAIFWIIIMLFSLEGASWARYYITSISLGDDLIFYGYSKLLTTEQIRNTQAKCHYYIINTVTGEESRIFDDKTEKEIGECQYLVLPPEKNIVLIVSVGYLSNIPESRFYLMDIRTKEARFLQKSEHLITGPSFSPDSKYIAFYSSDPQVDVWQNDLNGDHKACALMKIDAKTGELTEISPAIYILFLYSSPSWSPDGKEIAFIAQYSPKHKWNPQIFTADADGKNLKQLTSDDLNLGGSVAWSSKGKLLFTLHGSRIHSELKQGIYEIDSTGENINFICSIAVTNSPFHESIDKKCLIYNSYTGEDRKIRPFVINEQGQDITENKNNELYENYWKY